MRVIWPIVIWYLLSPPSGTHFQGDDETIVTTVEVVGWNGFSGDGGPTEAAYLAGPTDVAVGPDCSLFIADSQNNRIRRVYPEGNISTYAGRGQADFASGKS